MTYKGNQDSIDWIGRTGSHATRPLANGRIDLAPHEAKPEDYYNTVKDQWQSLYKQLGETRERVAELKAKLQPRLPYKEFQHFKQQYDQSVELLNKLTCEQADYRLLARAAAHNAFGSVFIEVAKRVLDKKVFFQIFNDARKILGRDAWDGIPERKRDYASAEERNRMNRHDGLKERRKHFRENHRKLYGDTLVWSDEMGGKIGKQK